MGGAPIAALAQWHDFYMLIGTAAATLVGLTCVAASVGASIFTEESEKALQSFLTPTVAHFAAVLFACAADGGAVHERAGARHVAVSARRGGHRSIRRRSGSMSAARAMPRTSS